MNCPACNSVLPMVRNPTSWRQAMWGGWTCANCGTEIDRRGRLIQDKAVRPKQGTIPLQTQNEFNAHGYAHYIIETGTLNVVVERERLESSLNSVENRFLLDLSEDNAKELLRTGRTTVTNLLGGRKETVTMKGCNCQNMYSHQRGGAAQFQM